MKSILITGGCGFIGSNFLRSIVSVRKYSHIVNLDCLTYAASFENLRDVENDSNYVHVKGDICDKILVNELFKKYHFNHVVHLAAESHVDRSVSNTTDFLSTNILGTQVLLEAARSVGVEKFIHISTDEVYGSRSTGFFDESDALRPSNFYSASKAAGDQIAHLYSTMYKMPIIVIRSGNCYGEFQYPEKLVPLAITNILLNQQIPLHGNGEHIRSWVHVSDFCRAVSILLESENFDGVYNISGQQLSNLEVVQTICSEMGKSVSDIIRHVNDRPNADHRYAPCGDRILKNHNFKADSDFANTVPSLIKSYVRNEGWWKNIRQSSAFKENYSKQAAGLWY